MAKYKRDRLAAQVEITRRMILQHLAILRACNGQASLTYIGEVESDVRRSFVALNALIEE